MRWLLVTAVVAGALPVGAQRGVFVTAGRVTAGDPNEASWRLTFQRDLVGPVGADLAFQVLPGARPDAGELYGVGGDVTLFADARRLPTVFVGAAAGIGVGDQERVWYGGSVGMRMPLVVLGSVRAMAEGRWRNLTVEGRDGLEFGIAIGYRPRRALTAGQSESAGLWIPESTADRLRAGGIPDAKARRLGQVVSTALEEMGQPYVWGGTGDGSGGFDCSGLIQYAYGRHGVRLPRTAASQANAGVAIRRHLDDLLPGDILTFSEHGADITHVGLYVGEGRFIHSASRGVRVSRLADDDPEGRWWLKRWVGVRRVVE